MKDSRSKIWRIVLIIVLYSLIRNWGDFKRGVIDGYNDGNQLGQENSVKNK